MILQHYRKPNSRSSPQPSAGASKETNMSGQAIAAEAEPEPRRCHGGGVSAWWRRRAPALLAVSTSRATEPPSRSQLMKLGLVAAVPSSPLDFSIMPSCWWPANNRSTFRHEPGERGLRGHGQHRRGHDGPGLSGTVGHSSGPCCRREPAAQRATASATRVRVGGALSIVVGCVFGMLPLFLRGPAPFVRPT